jgi:hypothetical protein
MFLKDEGGGITRESLEFWNRHKHDIGNILTVDVSAEGLQTEDRKSESGYTYPVEYNMMVTGTQGTILLSGCNCGYGGEGPNGTAKILAELGLTINQARAVMWQKRIHFDVRTGTVM